MKDFDPSSYLNDIGLQLTIIFHIVDPLWFIITDHNGALPYSGLVDKNRIIYLVW